MALHGVPLDDDEKITAVTSVAAELMLDLDIDDGTAMALFAAALRVVRRHRG